MIRRPSRSRAEIVHLIALALSTHSIRTSLDRLGIKIGGSDQPSISPDQFSADVARCALSHLGAAEAVYEILHEVEEDQRTGSFPVMHFARDHSVDYGDVSIMFAYYLRIGDQFPRPSLNRQEFLAAKRLMEHDPDTCNQIHDLVQVERKRREKVT